MSMTIGKSFAESGFNKIEKTYAGGKKEKVESAKAYEAPAKKVGKNNDISAQNESKLSEKAQQLLEKLREKYGDYDFMIANTAEEFDSLSGSGSKEFSVMLTVDEIEKMASDEEYAESQMKAVENAVSMALRISQENGYYRNGESGEGQVGQINKLSITISDDGSMKIFAELEKLSEKQRERIENAKEEKAAEEKAEAKKPKFKNPYEKDSKAFVKRTTIEASSEEEFLEMLKGIDWDNVSESFSGDRFNFQA